MDRFKKTGRRLRSKETSAEQRLWMALRNRQLSRWKFRRQHPVDRYVVDFVTLFGKLIVEVDGPSHRTPVGRKRDTQRALALEALGFRVIRVGNEDVFENLPGVMAFILRELKP
jgi:very-short-patch-repair endonuclease